MSNPPDEKSKQRVLWMAGFLVAALVALSFILGYLAGSSGKTTPIIIQKNSSETETVLPR